MNIADIEGIGPAYATQLTAAGIRTTDSLLQHGATRKGRQQLAEETGLSPQQILDWVNRADLYRIKGVASEYSDLLEVTGVDTVAELSHRRPDNLAAAFAKVVEERPELVRRVPSEKVVAGWIEQAKVLPRVVEY